MRKSKWNALSWVFLVLLAACEGFFAAVIVKLDMLPAKYGFLLLGIVVLLDLLAAILAFPKTGKWHVILHGDELQELRVFLFVQLVDDVLV